MTKHISDVVSWGFEPDRGLNVKSQVNIFKVLHRSVHIHFLTSGNNCHIYSAFTKY